MTPVATHIAKAEHRLDGLEPHTPLETAVVAIAHLFAAWVRWETGFVDEEDV